jgi:hypothetical protein
MKIIEGQVEDRNVSAGEWSRYQVGRDGVIEINFSAFDDHQASSLEVYLKGGKRLSFFNVAVLRA